MANTFELIASSTVGSGGASSIDFTSIPSTYTDLCVKLSARHSGSPAQTYLLTFNGATTNFSERSLEGTGSAVSSFSNVTSGASIYIGSIEGTSYTANTFTSTDIYIPNYAGSTNKSISVDNVTENNATAAYSELVAGLWSNTAAITSMKFQVGGGNNFVQYSTAYLYGVKNA